MTPRAGSLLLAALFALAPAIAAAQDSDEFGLKPDDGRDHDLMLPDPVLDRSWPAPEPGANTRPPGIAPDEEDVDPFREDERPSAPAPEPKDERGDEGEGDDEPAAPPRAPAPVPPAPAPTPVPEPDPALPDVLEPEIDEPAGLRDEDEPSPLDLDEQRYREESADPGE